MNCDWCFAPDPSWFFPCRPSDIPEITYGSVGGWMACDKCAAHVLRNERRELALECLQTGSGQSLTNVMTHDVALRWLLEAHERLFFSTRSGHVQHIRPGGAVPCSLCQISLPYTQLIEHLASFHGQTVSCKGGAYEIVPTSNGGLSIHCCKCGRTSHNPNDVTNRYCGYCHVFLEDT